MQLFFIREKGSINESPAPLRKWAGERGKTEKNELILGRKQKSLSRPVVRNA